MSRCIILERLVSVGCWRVVGQVARTRRRTELMPVLLRAREAGGTDARDLAGHLLFDSRSRRIVAERLLRIGAVYGLLDENNGVFVLTEAGKQAIDTEEVFVPEDGAWILWASDDPALPSPILRIEPWNEPSAFHEIIGMKRDGAGERRYETPPDWLRIIVGAPVTPAAGHAEAVRIDRIEDHAEAVPAGGALRLRWNVGDRRLELAGSLEGRRVATELEAPSVPPDRVWRTLLDSAGLRDRWDEERQALRVSFDETDDAEREAMSRSLKFESPDLPGYGTFEPLTVPGVAITTESKADAQSWAQWRLNARIRDYATSERYAAWCKEAADPFDRYGIELPTRADLARASWTPATSRPEPRAWHLAATEDWNL